MQFFPPLQEKLTYQVEMPLPVTHTVIASVLNYTFGITNQLRLYSILNWSCRICPGTMEHFVVLPNFCHRKRGDWD